MMFLRIISFIGVCILSLFFSPWIALLFVIAYTSLWHAYELFVLAAIIDGYFGGGLVAPYYTIVTVFVVVVLEWAKPSLAIYTN